MSFGNYERRLKENLIKKYNCLNKVKIDENFQLYSAIEFKNKLPIKISYKNISLLGDKFNIYISDNEQAQSLAYMCLGTGILEMNARGFGFVNNK